MLDIKFLRENPEIVKENIKKKFQDKKLPLVDEVIALDKELREARLQGDSLRAERNATSSAIGALMKEKKVEEANEKKQRVVEINTQLENIEKKETEIAEEIKKRMMVIPNIIDPSVPIGKDDSEQRRRTYELGIGCG